MVVADLGQSRTGREGRGLVEGVPGEHQCQTLGAAWMVVPFIRTDDLRKQQVLFGTRCELPGDPAQWEGWGLQFGAEPSLLGLTHISRGPLGARVFECREGMEIKKNSRAIGMTAEDYGKSPSICLVRFMKHLFSKHCSRL